ncbi:MAG: D-2-hydroxyacid dehydrogenase [Ruminococcaceae bacterium]|nr:D-2-hydroxyacid dehydrogenase [Oscillospiraceae bacterium]
MDKKLKIVCTDISSVTNGDVDISVLEKFGEVTCYDVTPPHLTAERIKDADIILINKTVIGKDEIDAAKKLRYIGVFATGYNMIDTEYAKERSIVVSNAGQYSTNAVAQHTFALMLELFSNTGNYGAFVARGGWKQAKIFTAYVGGTDEIYGKTIGIIGYGSIGAAVAKIALAFGMKVIAYTRTPKTAENVTFVDKETLFRESDVISVHCPLTKETEKLINRETLALCKDGVRIINTARGPIIDEEALLEALESGKVAGAGLDVLEIEPMSKDCPLFGAPNTVITPHVAWAPRTTRERLMGIVVSNIEAYLAGRPENWVNK